MKTKDLLFYSIIGAGAGYLFYQITKPSELKPKEGKRKILLVKFVVPKNTGESGLKKAVEQAKPKRIRPSFRPLGVVLEWDPITLKTPLGNVSFTPPKKFIPLKTIWEVIRAVRENKVKVVDKGTYWEVSFSITV